MNGREALIALNMIEGVGPVRVRQLLESFGDAEAVLEARADRLMQVRGVGHEVAEAIADWENRIDLQGELRRISEYRCGILTASDPLYPRLLREIYDPPIVLYLKGELTERDHVGLALVGSRQITAYGQGVARRLGEQLARAGITVVSGGARGIDTAAHHGVLNAGGRTVAVLGNGINIVYPSENARLFEQISRSGAVMTQFPFNRKGDKQTFPIRNRIVAGMTLGTVVVEAGRSSGALITANMAVDAGRPVFAVPGRVDSPSSRGCHDLIRSGAVLCEGTADIFRELEYLLPSEERGNSSSPVETKSGAPELGEAERAVYSLLSAEEMPIDEIAIQAGLSSAVVSVALLRLEMAGWVRQLPGKRFVREGAAP